MEDNKLDQIENIKQAEINKNDFGTLAIDLGSSTTVVVFQKENRQSPELLDLPPISRSPGDRQIGGRSRSSGNCPFSF